MAQIINNSQPREMRDPVVVESGISGWVMAVIILIAVIIGGVYAWRYFHTAQNNSTTPSTNINVTVPNPIPTGGNNSGSNGGTSGGSSGGTSGGSSY